MATAKKPVAKRAAPAKAAEPKVKPVGAVTHYYGGLGVAIVKFAKPVRRGVKVNFSGATTNFSQALDSMQFDHKDIDAAPKGKEVGVKVKEKVREGDEVFLVEE